MLAVRTLASAILDMFHWKLCTVPLLVLCVECDVHCNVTMTLKRLNTGPRVFVRGCGNLWNDGTYTQSRSRSLMTVEKLMRDFQIAFGSALQNHANLKDFMSDTLRDD
jgi:hypothetical protein